ncbi:MAG: glycosyltransferase family 4 protein [Verrucomicrobiota bacterium]|jgi:phosphatidylinositol alpha-1,6-mannosyltransferase|nr:glycosyltransferase family 4 protein [Verrucomicrobiota bacterium]
MKILMLTWNYPPTIGGIEQVAHYTATGLRRLGHDVTVVASVLPPGAGEAPEQRPFIHRADKKGIPAFLLHAVRTGSRLIRRQRPDVLLCPSLTSAPAAWLLSRRFRIPYAIQIHGSDILLPRRAYQAAIHPLLAGAGGLFANSRNTARLLQQRGLQPERIHVVYPGVTPPPTETGPSEKMTALAAAAEGRLVLLTVGRLVKRKGILEFIRDVMPLLSVRHPDLLYWVVGGEPSSSLIHQERIADQLAAAIREGGHENRVRLLGRLADADLALAYQQADLFVLPCLDDPNDVEGFGIVLLEAALRGVPGVATRCGGIPDAVMDGQTGVLVPPDDPAAMAGAIEALLERPEQRRRLGQAARERTLARFTWDAVAAQYAEGLRALLAARS